VDDDHDQPGMPECQAQ